MIAGMFALGWRAMQRFVFYERAIVLAAVDEKIAVLAGDVAALFLVVCAVGRFRRSGPMFEPDQKHRACVVSGLGQGCAGHNWPGRCVHLLYGCGRLYCRYTSFFRLCLG